MSWEGGHLARNGPKARKAPRGATPPSHPLPRPSHGPESDVLRAMFLGARASCPHRAEGPQGAERNHTPEPPTPRPRGGHGSDGVARERGCRPLAHTAGLRPACGRDARAPRVWPRERCSWERGHLARIGPNARKAPTGATCPSHQLPRPRRGDGSDGVSRERRRRDRLAMRRACGPLAGGTPALPGCGPGSDVPGSAGILPAPGRRPAKCREERHPRAGYSPAQGVVMGVMASPESAGVARERRRRPLGDVAGLRPACGRDARAPRVWPWERCSWERGHLARTGPKARKAPTGATPPSHQLPARGVVMGVMASPESVGVARLLIRRACGPVRAGRPRSQGVALGAMFLGARASCPHRAEGPQGADRSDTPEPPTPPPKAWSWE